MVKQFSDSFINRNRLFYCSHQNRKNSFFNKHILNSKNVSPKDLAQKIFDDQFGFVRIRRSLRESVLRLIQTVVVNQKKFDFNYYLSKNAPLPVSWATRKDELLEMSKEQGKRGAVYNELFEENNSSNEEVSSFLSEFIYQVFPKNFLQGCNKNKKVMCKKIL